MSLNVCVLASGSSGNCIYVGTETTKILVDAGLSCKATGERLSEIGVDVADIDAICVTHEHSDHKESLGPMFRRFSLPVYANSGAIDAMEGDKKIGKIDWNMFTTGSPFMIGDIRVEPFSVLHDSYDPVGFVFKSDGGCAGVVTDMGMPTGLVRERLKHCNVLVLESNHDEDMLKASERPWSLKQRILGRQGHLSNRQAAELLIEVAGPELKAVFLAHLSGDCNEPHLAMRASEAALKKCGADDVKVIMTYQSRATEVVEV